MHAIGSLDTGVYSPNEDSPFFSGSTTHSTFIFFFGIRRLIFGHIFHNDFAWIDSCRLFRRSMIYVGLHFQLYCHKKSWNAKEIWKKYALWLRFNSSFWALKTTRTLPYTVPVQYSTGTVRTSRYMYCNVFFARLSSVLRQVVWPAKSKKSVAESEDWNYSSSEIRSMRFIQTNRSITCCFNKNVTRSSLSHHPLWYKLGASQPSMMNRDSTESFYK